MTNNTNRNHQKAYAPVSLLTMVTMICVQKGAVFPPLISDFITEGCEFNIK